MLKPDENMSARPVAPRSKPSKDATRMNSVVSAGMALRQLNLEKDLIETREALFALQLEAETQARERADEEARKQAMRTILVDMDNTIAEFDGGVIEKYTVNHPEQVTHYALAFHPAVNF